MLRRIQSARIPFSQLRLKATAATVEPKVDVAQVLSSVPGPQSYPVLGAFPYFIKHSRGSNFNLYMEALYRDYGFISKMEVFNRRGLVLFHPDDVRAVYASDGKFPAPTLVPSTKIYYERRKEENLRLTTSDKENWRRLRSALQKHILPPQVANSYSMFVNPVSKDFSKVAREFQGELPSLISRYTFEAMANVLFGKRMGALEKQNTPENEKFVKSVIGMFQNLFELEFKFPQLWRYFDTPALKRSHANIQYLTTQGATQVLELASNFEKDPEKYGQTMVARILQAKELSFEEIAKNASGFFIAGVDTTANTLQWLLLRLAQNQRVQEKLAAEFKSVLKGNDYDESQLPNLPYLKACVRESSRLDTVVVGTSRTLQSEITLHNGTRVPAGALALIGTYPLHRDPKYFDQPEEFLPERWSEEAKAERVAKGNWVPDHPMVCIPFSFGPRMCIGSRLASMEMNSLLSRLLQDYQIKFQDPNFVVEKQFRLFVLPKVFPKLEFIPRT